MPKLDVGVGDEFPAKEVREEPEEEPVVHHHHYYRRRYGYYRQPGRWLFFVLWILVISLAFRILDVVFRGVGWGYAGWGGLWRPYGGWHGLEGLLWAILIIAGLIFMGRWGRWQDERDAERRDRDDLRSGNGR
jgi:hypothetical protein